VEHTFIASFLSIFRVYALKFNEGLVPFVNSDDINNSKAKTQIFVRVVGDELKEAANKVRPLLLIPGGPGLSHEYLDTIEAVAKSNRRVVSFDPVGTGLSSSVPAQTTAAIAAWANPLTLNQQAAAAAEAVGLAGKPHHVWAHGTGAAAAILYAAAHPDDVASLTLASPIFGRPPSLVVGSSDGNDKLTSLNPGTSSDPPRGNGPEIAALGSTQSTHPWRLSPDPTSALEPILANKRADLLTGDDSGPPLVCLDDAVKAGSGVLYEAWQPAEVGALEDAVRRIAEVNNGRRLLKCGGIPTLLTSGKRDLLATKASLDLARRLLVNVSTGGSEQSALSSSSSSSSVKVSEASPAGNQGNSKLKSPFLAGFPGVEEVVFPRSGHMAHLEEREDYLSKVFDFLAASDNSEK
jgi:pimeloyl-ACP methyl ester carboxylesterase